MLLSRNLIALGLLVAMANVAWAEAASYEITGKNTKVEFVGSKKDGKHAGGFKTVAGTAKLTDAADPTTLSLSVTITTDSLYSDDAKLTAHLKAPDFFEVKRFPEAKFESTKVTKDKKGYTVAGKLTLHGETKELSFPAEITSTAAGLTLTSKFDLNRSEWGISLGKGQINEAVNMSIGIEAKKK